MQALNSKSRLKAFDLVSAKNSNLGFLKDEVKHLRAQLDLLSKRMVSFPKKFDKSIPNDEESQFSYFIHTPVETPNIKDNSSDKSVCLEEVLGDYDNSFIRELNHNHIRIT